MKTAKVRSHSRSTKGKKNTTVKTHARTVTGKITNRYTGKKYVKQLSDKEMPEGYNGSERPENLGKKKMSIHSKINSRSASDLMNNTSFDRSRKSVDKHTAYHNPDFVGKQSVRGSGNKAKRRGTKK